MSIPARAGAVNEFLAGHATRAFGTMWAFYLLLFYGLLPLIFPDRMTTLLYWSNCVQLISLPLLMVGTNILGRAGQVRDGETHDAVMVELALLHGKVDDLAENSGAETALTVSGEHPQH